MRKINQKTTKADLLNRLYRLELEISNDRDVLNSYRRDYSAKIKERDALVQHIRYGKFTVSHNKKLSRNSANR